MVKPRPPQQVFTIVLEISTPGKRPPLIRRFTLAAPDEATALNKAFIHALRDNRRQILDHRISAQPGVYW